ncbi:PREDICTED: F-box only protein 7-like isoform X1 [Amphimedon queenslandica]|uniref:F-box domain-containing protein n=1 Tax=Amphimedon queenslandica TaxID=400682 RepID=A0AAN0IXC2_AMPQE|nr:PREDICTED: F-box only protein 7-like isoform X1 [Amphimedon queenslandica]|eukprot:XP_019849202.1 PREDICTED: F-box only protein 7-like isoform X1 [Amphimedon queenslandica]
MLIRVRLKRDLGARTVSLEVDPTKESLSDLRKKLYNYISSEYRFSKDSIHPIKNEKCPLQDIGLDEEDAFTLCLIPPNFEPNLDIGDFNFPIETTPTKINSGTTPRSASHTSELIIKAVTDRPPLPQGVLSTSNFGNFLRQNSSESKVGVVKSDSGVASSGDCVSFLCEALHMMMLDSGFSNKKDQNEQEQLKSLNRYQYIAPFGPIIPIEMVCTSLGPNLITHASINLSTDSDSATQVVTCVLPFDQYINKSSPNSSLATEPSSDTGISLTNTSQLTQTFKDAVPHHLLTDIRRALKLPEYGTLLCLSHEVKIFIMSLVDLKSLISLSKVNREFNILSQDEYLWKLLFIRDFKKDVISIPKPEEVTSWKEKYTEHYQNRKTRQEYLMNQVLLPARGRVDIDYSVPINPFPLSPPLVPLPLWGHDELDDERVNPHGFITERRRRRRREGLWSDDRLPNPFMPGPFW